MRPFAALVICVTLSSGCAYLDYNLRTVEDGTFYRSGQMTAGRLAEVIRDRDIQTVINLRGSSMEEWYLEETGVCAAYGVDHRDFDWTMRRAPEPESLAEFVSLLEEGERPMLVHCQGGTHRAGVASAVYVLLDGEDTSAAREQFTLFFNDAPIGQVVDWYEGSDMSFRDWVNTEYPIVYGEYMEDTAAD